MKQRSTWLHKKQLFIRWVDAEQEHLFCNYRFKHTKISANCLAYLCHPSRQILRAQMPKGIHPRPPCWLQNQALLSPGIKGLANYITIVADNTQTVQLHNTQLLQFLNKFYELLMSMKQSRGNTDALQGTSIVLRLLYCDTRPKCSWGIPFI